MEDLDFMKMLEQAKAMSEVFKESGDSSNNSQQQDSTEQMQKLMQIIKLFNTQKDTDNNIKSTAKHDAKERGAKNTNNNIGNPVLHTAELRAINDAIPYLELKHQKNLSIALKLIEIQNVIKFYNDKDALVKNKSFSNNSEWQKGILTSLRPHMPTNKKDIIDIALQLLEVKKIINKSNGVDNNEL